MLLDGPRFKEQLFNSITNCDRTFLACSAFIKLRALQDQGFVNILRTKEVVIIARWQIHDLITGASDLEIYELCKDLGWRFGIDLNLHGKLFLVDSTDIFLGSANLTQRGLHLGLTGNNEFGTRIPVGRADLDKIQLFINSEVTWMNDELYKVMSTEVSKAKKWKVPVNTADWSHAIQSMVFKSVEYLWVQELVFRQPSELLALHLDDDKAAHDFELLGLNIDDINVSSLRRGFKRTRLFRWLCEILSDQSLSFGGVTARLHLSILDDPKPYRVDIKTYNQVLFQWAALLDDVFDVSQPNHSQVIQLKR